jgi:ubiquinone biosynthesis protein UbiJ
LFAEKFIRPVEDFINRGIDQSGEAAMLGRELDGQSMLVNIDTRLVDGPLRFHVSVDDGRLSISEDIEAAVDAEVSATLIDLSRMIFIDPDLPFRDSRLRIQGDVDTAEKFRALFLRARPDLEEELSDLFGDELGGRMTNTFKRFRRFATESIDNLAEQVTNYYGKDGNQLPEPTEVAAFFDAVDELSNDLARTEKRISRIRAAIEKQKQSRKNGS